MRALRGLVLLAITALSTRAFAQAAHGETASWPPGLALSDPMQPVMDNGVFAHLLVNQLEGRLSGGADLRWDAQGWLGTDTDKLWLKSEGFLRHDGKLDDGRHEILYDRAITTYFDVQAGLRSDIDQHPVRNWAGFGVQGLAPLFFDVEATGYISGDGHLAARFEASYDLYLTQRLILQPEAEINLYSKRDRDRLVGAGFSDLDAGLRLRYEITRTFAPYIGAAYEGKFGETGSLARRAGERSSAPRFVFGVKGWF